MTTKQKSLVLNQNRTLIEVYANLKETSTQANNDNLKIALALIDKAIDLLSEV